MLNLAIGKGKVKNYLIWLRSSNHHKQNWPKLYAIFAEVHKAATRLTCILSLIDVYGTHHARRNENIHVTQGHGELLHSKPDSSLRPNNPSILSLSSPTSSSRSLYRLHPCKHSTVPKRRKIFLAFPTNKCLHFLQSLVL